MRLGVVAATFALVLTAELPDKTALASLVLATRYRPSPVWVGAAGAFLVHCALAVTAGRVLALMPHRVVPAFAAVLFAVGAVVTFRSTGGVEEVAETAPATSFARVAAASFGVLLVAELGDFTQLATAALASRYDAVLSVFLGAWLALFAVVAAASAVEALRQ